MANREKVTEPNAAQTPPARSRRTGKVAKVPENPFSHSPTSVPDGEVMARTQERSPHVSILHRAGLSQKASKKDQVPPLTTQGTTRARRSRFCPISCALVWSSSECVLRGKMNIWKDPWVLLPRVLRAGESHREGELRWYVEPGSACGRGAMLLQP